MRAKLSLIDFGLPATTLELAAEADELGYTRYWLGEHHAPFQSASPLLMTAVVAGITEHLRVGPAGVCLDLYSTLKIAEDARLLEEVFPRRIDLGAVRGLAITGPEGESLRDGRPPGGNRSFEEKEVELHGLLRGRLPADHPLRAAHFGSTTACPELWVLGAKPEAADRARKLGANFCFSEHHNRLNCGGQFDIGEALRRYRQDDTEPRGVFAALISGLCARSHEEAEQLFNRIGRFMPLSFLGSSDECAEQIEAFSNTHEVDEVVLLNLTDRSETVRDMLAHQSCVQRELARLLIQRL
jgi:luciferase family oxidoreductase group 1